jgi:hypothetical protein
MDVFHLNMSEYAKWFRRRSSQDKSAVMRRLDLLSEHGLQIGLPNVRRINLFLWELRTPGGLRLYFTIDRDAAIFLAYGNKDSQQRDIDLATSRALGIRNGI